MSLIGLALCVFVVIATLASVDVSAVVIGRARAQTAADLAALAAVTPYPLLPGPAEEPGSADRPPTDSGTSPTGSGSPMERAVTVAAANGGRVISCSCGPLTATIAVAVRVPLVPFSTSVEVRAYARAVLAQATDPGSSRVG